MKPLAVAFTGIFVLCFFLTPVLPGMGKNPGNPLKVEIISPRDGQTIRGKISVQAHVNNPDQVNFIDFYIQEPGAKDRYGWKSYFPPYLWGGDDHKLDTTLFADGPASVAAFCHSKDSRLPVTQSRVHFVIDNGKPKVKILSPKDSAGVSGNVSIRVDASDPIGIQKKAGIVAVYVYADGSLLQKLVQTPYQTQLSTCLLAPGLHSIRAVAEDTDGLTTADTVLVSVNPKL